MRMAILCVALLGCGGDDDGGGGGGGGDPAVVLMETVGPEGGDFEGDGIKVTFQADSVTEPLELMVTAAAESVSGYQRYSPVFTFEPSDFELENPIEVEIESSEPDGTFYWTALGSDIFEVPDGSVVFADSVVGTVQHLGRGFVGKPGETGNTCGDGPACTGTDICIDGVCMPYEAP